MAIKTDPKERQICKKELIETMLQRAGVTEKEIYEVALKDWINNNLDVLTREEILKYRKYGVLKYNKLRI